MTLANEPLPEEDPEEDEVNPETNGEDEATPMEVDDGNEESNVTKNGEEDEDEEEDDGEDEEEEGKKSKKGSKGKKKKAKAAKKKGGEKPSNLHMMVLAVIQHMCSEAPDRADVRGRLAESVLTLVKALFSTNPAISPRFVLFLAKLIRSNKVGGDFQCHSQTYLDD